MFFQVTLKFIFLLKSRHAVTATIADLNNIYVRLQTDEQIVTILNKFSKLLKTSLRILFTLYSSFMCICFVSTILLNTAFRSQFVYLLSFYLPLVPTDTVHGFVVNNVWQNLSGCFGLISYAYFDGFHAIFVLHVLLYVRILCHKVQQINRMAVDERSVPEATFISVKELILLHNEMRL